MEILFRGISEETKQWEYGFYFHQQDGLINDHFIIDKRGFETKIVPGTDGQFTGLTDKVKCRYFDGDIGTYFNNCKFVVVWDNGWYAEFVETKKRRNLADFHEETVRVGSIHDNTELLK